MILFLINQAIGVLVILIIVRAILSWIPEITWRYREITRVVERITEPILRPFRQLLPPYKTGGIDLSPALAIIALAIIQRLLDQLLIGRVVWR